MAVQKQVYRPKEAATYLGVSLATLWSYIKKGRLTSFKLSEQATGINISELERFVAEASRCSSKIKEK